MSNSVITNPSISSSKPSISRSDAQTIPTKIAAEFMERASSAVYPEYSLDMNAVLFLSGRIDEDRLMRAVRLVLDAEPILGCRFVERWFRPYWRRYDDLDAMKFCEVRASSDCETDMRRFLETPLDFPLLVLLLRGDADVLCIKLDHRIADGPAMAGAIHLLADIYNRLGEDRLYRPAPNLESTRSMRQIGDQFGLREKWRIFRVFYNSVRQAKNLGKWQYPVPADGRRELQYVIWRLEGDRLAAISKYAFAKRATVNQVLLAALYIAAYNALPHSSDLPLQVRTTVDLRRYLPLKKASGVCNLFGQSRVAVDPRKGASLDTVVHQIREQMHSQQKEYFGLPASVFPYHCLPIRYVIELIPYWYIKRLGRRAIEANQKRVESRGHDGHFPGMVLLSNGGEIDPTRIAFAGTEITNAFGTTGVVKNPGLLGLTVSRFKGSLTLCLGMGPTSFVTDVSRQIMQILPT
jgi:NRPS condensation-like uncharacterized protein